MKPVALLLLFGLCTAIGMQIAAKKTERYARLGALLQDLSTFSELLDTDRRSLPELAAQSAGELFERLGIYLAVRGQRGSEIEAAKAAADAWANNTEEHRALTAFFTGLSALTAEQMKNRIDTLTRSLETARTEAEQTAKQAKTIRAVGVLIGAGICILLG